MARRLHVLSAAVVLSLAASVADAEVKRGAEVGLYAGTMKAYAGKTFVVDGFRTIETTAESGQIYGLRLGYNFTQHLGFEWNIGQSTARYDVTLFDNGFLSPGGPRSDAIVSEEDTTGVGFSDLNLVLHLLKGPIVPFLTGGAGFVMTVDRFPFGYNFGGGLKIFLTKRLAIRGDFREYRAKLKDNIEQIDDIRPGGVFVGRTWDYSENLRYRELSGGLTFLFH